MARPIHSWLKVKGELIAQTPLHVGGFGTSADTDLPLAQNGKGEWYVPGTSIAGVLRSWCQQSFGKKFTKSAWGFQRQVKPEEENTLTERQKGHASFVTIEDAKIRDQDNVQVEVRDGVGIDRFYGTAADKAKYDRAVLPRGSELEFEMTVEIEANSVAPKIKAMLGHLLAALAKGNIRIGAARTRGLGRVRLRNCTVREERLDCFRGILDLLENKSRPPHQQPSASLEDWLSENKEFIEAKENEPIARPRLDIIVRWKPLLPVMVKAGYDGIGVDMLPLTSGVGAERLALVLPGSSIKGALRSHAERIVRTVLDCGAVNEQFRTEHKETFHDQIELPLIDELFGARNKPGKSDISIGENRSGEYTPEDQSVETVRPGLGALAVDDCYAQETHFMDAKRWRDVELALDDKPGASGKDEQRRPKQQATQDEQGEVSYFQRELWKKLREIDTRRDLDTSAPEIRSVTKQFKVHHHVAIDRWTGGASEGALYSVLSPGEVEWDPMTLTLDFGRLPNDLQMPGLMLLLLTLRDVADNRLPFGFATNRGMGEIEVTDIKCEGQFLSAELKGLEGLITSGKFTELSDTLRKNLNEEWERWRTYNQNR
jgi:CRISPR/Cas system CSM-associated protein Csm3 (group 7 of RAMP superfamily)